MIMNNHLLGDKDYDIDGFYAKTQFNAVHIGDFVIKKEASKKQITNDKIAVIMPVYNDHEYLEEAIKSILNQTY